MRIAVAGAFLALSLGVAGCSRGGAETDLQDPEVEVDEPDRSITATQLLETTDWPQGAELVPLRFFHTHALRIENLDLESR